MRSIFKLIRWKNLFLIALTQVFIKYALFTPLYADITLNGIDFTLLVFATLCIAAAGNIINDIYDVETDLINKSSQVIVGKTISEKKAFNLFFLFSVLGVGVGFYISNLIGKSGFSALFVITSALLYIYSTYLKQTILIGNIVVSGLVAMSIIIVGLFDLLPAITSENQQTQLKVFKIILNYALFAFILNFLREIIKDIEDMEGDAHTGMKTFPIAIGHETSLKVLFGLSLIPLIALLYYSLNYLYIRPVVLGYVLIFIIGPFIYFILNILNAKSKKQLHHLSNIIKGVMLTGVLSLIFYTVLPK